MRYLYIALLITFILFASCKKRYMNYTCRLNPTLILAPDGYTQAQWDTLVLKLYTPNTQQLVSTDTFLPKNLQDVVVLYVDENYKYDLSVNIPATSQIHWLKAISITKSTVRIKEGTGTPDCYKNLSYTVDGTAKHHNSTSIITERLKNP